MSDGSPIPREFYSEYTELPFSRCIACECSLLDSDVIYSVIKHIVGKETVFEMAICMDCAAKMREQYSKETSENIQKFIAQKLREKLFKKMDELEASHTDPTEDSFSVEEGLGACAFCEKPRKDCHRLEIVALFQQDEIVLNSGQGLSFSSPMMLCQDCNSETSKLISRKTRETWDRFVEEHFDGPPGVTVDGPQFEPILF